MRDDVQAAAPSAYAYPLLIKQLLHTPFLQAPDQEIVYRGQVRMTYTTLRERIARLASGLSQLGARHGSTVAVMDWDSHRYLECYFAVPMMGAVLQTVNVRLSHDEIAYTINHAGAEILFVHTDFLPVVEAIKDQLETVRTFVWIDEEGSEACTHSIPFATEYEAMLAASSDQYDFPDFDENTRATTFYTTGTTGLPKGVYFSHRQLVLHTITVMAALASPESGQRFHRGDVYMPLTPMFHVHAWGMPYIATVLGVKQVYPGRYLPERLVQLVRDEARDLLALRQHDSAHDAELSRSEVRRLQQVEDRHWRRGADARTRARRSRSRHRYLYGLRHVRDVSRAEPRSTAARRRGAGCG